MVLMSDHGQPMGEGEHGHGIMRKCRPWPYEELVQRTLIMHVPGIEGGKRIKSFVQNVDVTATIMDALGSSARRRRRAISASRPMTPGNAGHQPPPVMRGETDTVRDCAIAGYYGMSWSPSPRITPTCTGW
ncbi:MAG: sulfatase-like hydrolase/transferase [Bilophila wadsworthia]